MKVIFAQANPGEKYSQTRHNAGLILLDIFAQQHDVVWKDAPKFRARIAELSINGEKTLLVNPQTYYNDTGLSARAIVDFYKLDPAMDFLVIHDDLALPFGTIRTRQKGSDAGNNGIKSLNAHLGENYSRIRVGIAIDRNAGMSDVDFVLGRFSSEDVKVITDTLATTTNRMIESFVQGNLESTSQTHE
jgi:PTH1 family peptidyl-tRNA hydrolase